MNATVNADGSFSVVVDGDTVCDLFESISSAQEVFGNLVCKGRLRQEGDDIKNVVFDKSAPVLTSDRVVLRVRTDDDDNKYYEAMCVEPGPLMYCKKKFGVHKKGGGLFPKSNWVKYFKDEGKELDVMTGEEV